VIIIFASKAEHFPTITLHRCNQIVIAFYAVLTINSWTTLIDFTGICKELTDLFDIPRVYLRKLIVVDNLGNCLVKQRFLTSHTSHERVHICQLLGYMTNPTILAKFVPADVHDDRLTFVTN
jgi:hypothetical protein